MLTKEFTLTEYKITLTKRFFQHFRYFEEFFCIKKARNIVQLILFYSIEIFFNRLKILFSTEEGASIEMPIFAPINVFV